MRTKADSAYYKWYASKDYDGRLSRPASERGFQAGWKAAIEHITTLLESGSHQAQLTDLIQRMPVHGMPESDSAWCAAEVVKHIKHRIEMEAV